MSEEQYLMGRPTEFGDLSPFTLEQTEYRSRTETAVHCYPVSLGGQVIGYLWASDTEDAADFWPRRGMGAVGFDAGGPWRKRLKEARDAGFTAWEAVQLWLGEPEDPRGGCVLPGAEGLFLPNFRAVQLLARQPLDE
ncbi:hypothetical protein ACIBLA_33585 [Streptomyces sp. NPDC050433]|uniref:hypothetical protein n=1 Tax=unclassified Streptomyces TaxID=2593676 RepID=UPI00344A4A6E